MEIIKGSDLNFIPASHEDPANPACLKKVLCRKDDLVNGWVQMINWSLLLAHKSFEKHYHEDMEEVFIIIEGEAKIIIDNESAILKEGDAVIIPIRAIHQMTNDTDKDTKYLAIGIATGTEGKTVNL